MKIVNKSDGRDNKTVAAEQRQVRRQQEIIGHLLPKPGQKVFQFSLETEAVTEAKIEATEVKVFAQNKHGHITNNLHKKVTCLPGHIYCVALNLDNAKRKFAKKIAALVAAGILKKV